MACCGEEQVQVPIVVHVHIQCTDGAGLPFRQGFPGYIPVGSFTDALVEHRIALAEDQEIEPSVIVKISQPCL